MAHQLERHRTNQISQQEAGLLASKSITEPDIEYLGPAIFLSLNVEVLRRRASGVVCADELSFAIAISIALQCTELTCA